MRVKTKKKENLILKHASIPLPHTHARPHIITHGRMRTHARAHTHRRARAHTHIEAQSSAYQQ